MTKHSEGLGLSPEVAAAIDRGWDGPEEDGEVLEIYGTETTQGVTEMHAWDVSLDGVTVTSMAQLEEWLRVRRIQPDTFKRYTSYLGNVDRKGFEWLRAL